jgi:hypothetical protein
LTPDKVIDHFEDFISTTRRTRTNIRLTITRLISLQPPKGVATDQKHEFLT